MINKILNIIKKYKNKNISREQYTDNTIELKKLSKDNSFVGTEGWAFEGFDDDTKYISCCENAKNDILNKIITEVKMTKLFEKSYTTAEEFNQHMSECVEYKKLIELQKQLKWFGDEINGLCIIQLKNEIKHRLNEIPEVSKVFDTL